MTEGPPKDLPAPEGEPLKVEIRLRMGSGVKLAPDVEALLSGGQSWDLNELRALANLQKTVKNSPQSPLDTPEQTGDITPLNLPPTDNPNI